MRSVSWVRSVVVATFVVGLSACQSESPAVVDSGTAGPGTSFGKEDASAEAVFLDFEWDGELIADGCWSSRSQIDNQLLYTIGQLNGERAVGRLDRLEITATQTGPAEGGGCTVTYHARMPVAWSKKSSVPETYELKLPHRLTGSGVARFVDTYKTPCAELGAHDVTAGSFWYYYRPHRSGCKIEDADLWRAAAKVTPSPIQTTGKYPEFHKIWEDNAFEVLAVFGKYEDGATLNDAGISAYNQFNREVRDLFAQNQLTATPADAPANPGVEYPDITYQATLPGGRTVRVTALLVDSVGSAPTTFWKRYETLTPTADYIIYNGHAGLGANIRRLAGKGVWRTGQYAVVFMNGCDTYAYIDSALADAHAKVNADDDTGTKYVDVVANAMPSFFRSMADATMALMKGLLDYERPRTYEQIFKGVDSSEVVLVTGEHDNVFVPGYQDGPTDPPAFWRWATRRASRPRPFPPATTG